MIKHAEDKCCNVVVKVVVLNPFKDTSQILSQKRSRSIEELKFSTESTDFGTLKMRVIKREQLRD